MRSKVLAWEPVTNTNVDTPDGNWDNGAFTASRADYFLVGERRSGRDGDILAGYVALKGISRQEKSERQEWVSLHSLWASAVSVGFAFYAGWLYP